MKPRDSRVFCRCGLMWGANGVCPHCDDTCPTPRTCARCKQYAVMVALDPR